MSNRHSGNDVKSVDYPTSALDNATPKEVRRGDTIIERDAKGRIQKKFPVTEVIVSPDGCKTGVHITVRGGNVWCYDLNAAVEIDREY